MFGWQPTDCTHVRATERPRERLHIALDGGEGRYETKSKRWSRGALEKMKERGIWAMWKKENK